METEEKVDPFKLIPDYDSDEFYDKPECKLSYYENIKDTEVLFLDDDLYVVMTYNGNWAKFHFLSVNSWDTASGDIYVESLFKCEGPGGPDHPLRECRHTYFPNDGYVFYMNKRQMGVALEFLTIYFDMD